jgi:hypothetical protein
MDSSSPVLRTMRRVLEATSPLDAAHQAQHRANARRKPTTLKSARFKLADATRSSMICGQTATTHSARALPYPRSTAA